MLKHIREANSYVGITGFRDVKVEQAEDWLKAVRNETHRGAAVQLFDAELIATWEHIYFAVLNALTAFRNRRSISKNVAVEVLLYASAQRQIRKAIALIGVKSSSKNVAVVAVGEDPVSVENVLSAVAERFGKKPDESVLELSKHKQQCIRRAFGISDKELDTVTEKDDSERALVNLVVERMALLSTKL
jgi:tRNA threonylcarbamoyladenosine modification (KEOPS) complex Cgi121 subunit